MSATSKDAEFFSDLIDVETGKASSGLPLSKLPMDGTNKTVEENVEPVEPGEHPFDVFAGTDPRGDAAEKIKGGSSVLPSMYLGQYQHAHHRLSPTNRPPILRVLMSTISGCLKHRLPNCRRILKHKRNILRSNGT